MTDVELLTGVCTEEIDDPAISFPYTPDDFQRFAFARIAQSKNILVTAHTGCGKTAPAIYAIAHHLRESKRRGENRVVVYTSPVKALSNQKYQEFRELFDDVGLITGDNQINPTGNLLIMTTEILQKSLYRISTGSDQPTRLSTELVDRISCVIFDEVHFFNDPERGSVWEESITLLPNEVAIVALSATIDKADDFADWIGRQSGRGCSLIPTEKRVIPLRHTIYHRRRLELVESEDGKFDDASYDAVYAAYRGDRRFPKLGLIREALIELQKLRLLPAICFVFNKRLCEEFAELAPQLATPEERAQIEELFHVSLRRHHKEYETKEVYHQLKKLLGKGVAYHHAGLYPVLREVVETVFKAGLIKALFATETFAVGVNMPATSVVFTSLEKRDNKGRRLLRTDEYRQMAGRAGRRGLDPRGMAIILPIYPLPTTHEVKEILRGRVPSLSSQFRVTYSFLLKIILSETTLDEFLASTMYDRERKLQLTGLERERGEVAEVYADLTSQIDELNGTIEDRELLRDLIAREKGSRLPQRRVKQLRKRDREPWVRETLPLYRKWLEVGQQLDRLEREISGVEGGFHGRCQQLVEILYRLGYLATDRLEDCNPKTVTVRGMMAAQSDKCNSLWLTEIVLNRLLDDLDERGMVALLATLVKGGKYIDDFLWESTDAPIRGAIDALEEITREYWALEDEYQLPLADWELGLSLVEPAYRWASGARIEDCLTDDIDGGHFVRAMLKLRDLVGDAITLCEIAEQPEAIPRLRKIESLLIRDVVSVTSLYLE